MLCILNINTDPYFNIACEEYLFNELEVDSFMLYRNENAIIVGKHQNTLAEINYKYAKENNIKVVRRLSGGGTVYHDLGNLNFTFIRKNQSQNLVNFRKHMQAIVDVLLQLGVVAEVGKKNDLTIDGKKFSGNAEHVYKDKVLHHGTLLFSSDINVLSQALEVNPNKYKDKAVKSVRSKVINIGDYLLEKTNIQHFAEVIMNHIIENTSNARAYHLSAIDIDKIQKLVESKYATWEWNFAYSPAYIFKNNTTSEAGNTEISLEVENGIIKQLKLSSDLIDSKTIAKIENILLESRHEEIEIRTKLENLNFKDDINHIIFEELIKTFF